MTVSHPPDSRDLNGPASAAGTSVGETEVQPLVPRVLRRLQILPLFRWSPRVPKPFPAPIYGAIKEEYQPVDYHVHAAHPDEYPVSSFI